MNQRKSQNTPNTQPLAPQKAGVTNVPERKSKDSSKPVTVKKTEKAQVPKKVWTNKKGEQYDGPMDDDQPQIEENGYFESQLEKAIKSELTKEKAPTAVQKAPTTQVKVKEDLNSTGQVMKLIDKQMNDEMSKQMDEEIEKYEK